MKTTSTRRGRRAFAALLSLAFVAAACGSDSKSSTAPTTTAASVTPATDAASTPTTGAATPTTGAAAPTTAAPSTKPVTISWWHIQNNDPGKADWQAMADAYTKLHPNVTIKITVMENEAFKAAIQTNIQSGSCRHHHNRQPN